MTLNRSIRVASINIRGADDHFSHSVENGKCILGGAVGAVYQFILDATTYGFNCSWILSDDYGSYDVSTNSYIGILGTLEKNLSDVALIPVEYPSKLDYVEYSGAYFEDFLGLASAYDFTEEQERKDILDMFIAFDWSYDFSVIFMTMFFVIVWSKLQSFAKKKWKYVKEVISNTHKSSTWLIICALMDQDQFPDFGICSFNLISILVVIFYFFFIKCFMMNMLGTDLSVVKEPHVITSYDDILSDPDIKVMLLSGSPEAALFSNSPENSIENIFWNRREVVGYDVVKIMDLLNGLFDQRYVAIMQDWLLETVGSVIVSRLGDRMNNHRFYLGRDETEKKILKTFQIHRDADPIFKQRWFNMQQRGLESGIVEYLIKKKGPCEVSGCESVSRRFISSQIFLGSVPDPYVGIENVPKLFRYCFSLLVFGLIILFFEKFHFKVDQEILSDKRLEMEKKMEKTSRTMRNRKWRRITTS